MVHPCGKFTDSDGNVTDRYGFETFGPNGRIPLSTDVPDHMVGEMDEKLLSELRSVLSSLCTLGKRWPERFTPESGGPDDPDLMVAWLDPILTFLEAEPPIRPFREMTEGDLGRQTGLRVPLWDVTAILEAKEKWVSLLS
jgi:hypothetical protein